MSSIFLQQAKCGLQQAYNRLHVFSRTSQEVWSQIIVVSSYEEIVVGEIIHCVRKRPQNRSAGLLVWLWISTCERTDLYIVRVEFCAGRITPHLNLKIIILYLKSTTNQNRTRKKNFVNPQPDLDANWKKTNPFLTQV